MSAATLGTGIDGLVKRQFKYLLGLTGPERLLFLSRLLHFLETEPGLTGILEDLRHEAGPVLVDFQRADQAIRTELAIQWTKHRSELSRCLAPLMATEEGRDQLTADATLESYGDRLRSVPVAVFPDPDARGPTDVEKLVLVLKKWHLVAKQQAQETATPLSPELTQLKRVLEDLERAARYAARHLSLGSRTLGWPALQRLRAIRDLSHPTPPLPSEVFNAESVADYVRYREANRVARAIHGGADEERDDKSYLARCFREVGTDAKTLREELVLRVGRGRSRIALVRRFAARCEAFDAERLRTACSKSSKRAEALLTLEFARFLFDAGLSPILDATTSGLRPDVLHIEPASLFYVEAKQYNRKNPRAQIKKAYAQVWSTWGRLRRTYPCPEAFLVVFRRTGPYAELPPVLRHGGLRLYSVLADISEEAGSREKSAPVVITEDELLPKSDHA